MSPSGLEQLPLMGLVFARCGGLLAVAPPLNVRQFPPALRLGIALVLAVALAPVAGVSHGAAHLPLTVYLVMLLREAAAGALMGLGAALVFWAFLVAGQLLDVWLGAAEAGPRSVSPGPMATLLYLTAGAAFLVLDGHQAVIAALAGSLRQLPLGATMLSMGALTGAAALVEEMLAVGVALAAPALAVMYAAQVALASFARSLPQLELGEWQGPVRWSAGVLGLVASTPLLARALLSHSVRVLEALQTLVRLLAGGA